MSQMTLFVKTPRLWDDLGYDVKFKAYFNYALFPNSVLGATVHEQERKRAPFADVKRRHRYLGGGITHCRLESCCNLVKRP